MMKTATKTSCGCERRPIKGKNYVGWHNEAERRTKAGWTQERCPDCGKWTKWYTPAESRAREADCRACGACCVSYHDQEAFCDVHAKDLDKLSRSWVKKNVLFARPADLFLQALDGRIPTYAAIKTKWTKQKAGPLKGLSLCQCVALRGSVMHQTSCRIYDDRPEACREAVKPGTKTCLAIRDRLKDAAERLQREGTWE